MIKNLFITNNLILVCFFKTFFCQKPSLWMATGGGNGDSQNEGLDLIELESELEAFGEH